MLQFYVSSRPAVPPKRKPQWVVVAETQGRQFVVAPVCISFHDANSIATMLTHAVDYTELSRALEAQAAG